MGYRLDIPTTPDISQVPCFISFSREVDPQNGHILWRKGGVNVINLLLNHLHTFTSSHTVCILDPVLSLGTLANPLIFSDLVWTLAIPLTFSDFVCLFFLFLANDVQSAMAHVKLGMHGWKWLYADLRGYCLHSLPDSFPNGAYFSMSCVHQWSCSFCVLTDYLYM